MASCDYCEVITGNNGRAHRNTLQHEICNGTITEEEVDYPQPKIPRWETSPNCEGPDKKKAEKKAVTFRIDKNSIHSIPRIDDSRSGAFWLFLSFKRRQKKEESKRQKKEASKKVSKKSQDLYRFSNGLFLDS